MSGTEILEWCGYTMVKKFEDIFIYFDRIHERDGHADGQTGIVRAYTHHTAKTHDMGEI